MMKTMLATMTMVGMLAVGTTGWACSLVGFEELMIDASLPATVWTEFTVEVDSIKRGENSGSSCDDLGWVVLKITDAPPEAGFTFEVVDGVAPENFSERNTPVVAQYDNGNRFTLVWSEDMSDDQPPLDFTIRVTPYGPNGDPGTAQDVVVSHPGVDGGCSAAGTNDLSALSLLLFGALFFATRRLI